MGRRYLIAAALLLAAGVEAAPPGGCDGVLVQLSGARQGCARILNLNTTMFTASGCAGGACVLGLADAVTRLGQVIGDSPNDFADPVLGDGKQWDLSAATSLKVPVATGTQPTADGSVRLNDDLDRLEVGSDGTRTLRFSPGPAARAIGGVEATNTFTYAGEVTSPTDCSSLDTSCTRTVCRCGICTGSNGSGTCTLDPNSMWGRGVDLVTGVKPTTVLSLKTFAHTAGTITIKDSTSTVTTGGTGSTGFRALVIRVRDDASFTSGTLTVAGKAGFVTTGGTVLSTMAGRSGGNLPSFYLGGVAGGNTSGTAGGAGIDAEADALALGLAPHGLFACVGTGGGTAPVTGNGNAASVEISRATLGGTVAAGALGGGGGGCAGSATGTAGDGGKGGGFVRIEVGGKATFGSTYTISAMGADGGRNGGGGGGGCIHVLVGELSGTLTQDTGTCTAAQPRLCVGGGAGGTSGGNCGAGGAGGDGLSFVEVVPR